MYFKVRKIGEKDLIVNLPTTAEITKLKKFVAEKLGIKPDNQMLIYQGKELNDQQRIVDYKIKLNDIVQLIDRELAKEAAKKCEHQAQENCEETKLNVHEQLDNNVGHVKPVEVTRDSENPDEIVEDCKSRYYEKGEVIDFLHCDYGSWYEGIIMNIVRVKRANTEMLSGEKDEENLRFKVKMNIAGCAHEPFTLSFHEIRPRAYRRLQKKHLKVGDVVLVNYNPDEPSEFGYWYDFIVESVDENLTGSILLQNNGTTLENCIIKFDNCIMQIEKAGSNPSNDLHTKKCLHRCKTCKDIPKRRCKTCGCKICYGKANSDTIVLCDDCDEGYHIACLDPPLPCIPSDSEWYCPSCKTDENEIVKPGEKLKLNKKKNKISSNKTDSDLRDWGNGMGCAGRTRECTIVQMDHFGPVPGVDVGTCWKFRMQVSEAGIHRPPVAGIHGRENDGAYSVVLSGGYEDDIDNGDEFYYTGCGGRNLGITKRTSKQAMDQTLTNMNKALALNCNAPFNEKGAEAIDWKAGKPVRVIRNYKLAKHSKYAPKDGNRYDGIYKVVKYFPVKGKSGFLVWRYLLRRDDPAPAPWHKKGRELPMLYPDGYLEAQLEKQKDEMAKNGWRKRSLSVASNALEIKSKKIKLAPYKLDQDTLKLINSDKINENLWAQSKESLSEGKQKFLEAVQNVFCCVCCLDIVSLPVTTSCKHNICKNCLERSFSVEIFSCPTCRFNLSKNYKIKVNEKLTEALQKLFPGYRNKS